ncbi:MAG: OmpA family protein, partial [Bacteroidetes bacterium]|nr:OmpA family protein [Bacteroidota bacterium]
INSDYWEGHVSLSGDENELYFSSDRVEGFGGKDIYKVTRLPDGSWSDPVNLGPNVNTPYDEDAPFIHPDGVTMYYSSKGHSSMGGYDIFRTIWNGENFDEPKNMGYPINTADDDLYFVISGDGKTAYFSSFRAGGYGHQDIYKIDLPEEYYKKPVYTLMTGKVMVCGKPYGADILVYNNETGKLQGLYKANSATGKYLISIPAGRNYNVTIRSKEHIFHSENIYFPAQDSFVRIYKDIDLLCGELGDRICLNNIFFESYGSNIKPESKQELDNIAKFMKQNPLISLRIISYVDEKILEADIAYARSLSVVEELVDRRIKIERLFPEGYAVFDDPVTEEKKNKVCLQIIGGHLGKETQKSKRKLSELDQLYYKVVEDCGEYIFNDIIFKVQIGAFRNPVSARFDDLRNKEWIAYLKMEKEIGNDGITRFTVGPFETLNEAEDLRQNIIEVGIFDAWTVPFRKGRRITIDQVRVICNEDSSLLARKGPMPLVFDEQVVYFEGDDNIIIMLQGFVVEDMGLDDFPLDDVSIDLFNKGSEDYEGSELTLGDGIFIMKLRSHQNYAIIASKPGYSSGREDFSTNGYYDGDTVKIVLTLEQVYELVTLEGIVVMKESQEPIPDATVQLQNKTLQLLENYTLTAPDGTFGFTVNSNTIYELLGYKPTYTKDRKTISTIDKTRIDRVFVKIELEQAPCIKLDGIVIEAESELPIPKAFVEVFNKATKQVEQSITNQYGEFQGCVEPEQNIIIKASRQGYFTNCVEVSSHKLNTDDVLMATIVLEKIVIGKEISIDNIYYDFNKSNIRRDAAMELNKIVSVLENNPTIKIELGSHSDARGSDSYNLTLSQKRAQSAVNYIINKGIFQNRIIAKGYGESKLVNRCHNGVNCSDEEHQANRRTEFKVTGFTSSLEEVLVPGQMSNVGARPGGFIDCPTLDMN